ncbi:hypothetical protein [Bergeyella zoohelcum]|uniref:Uncharacterized protein n=1 Tax=Bergeyella zoohelcum TaxID=1015 RepID=A0A376BZN4_9FLAO|nr:hypothetical protein [Bergeyella zoohelcum]EKB60786.1 hypothetical protein HMPREF9700_00281 [Bergeyella zoohelcum CCUG 30536]SSZ47123.1 Uncharacterised protein [Bergeyella zoohelcum]
MEVKTIDQKLGEWLGKEFESFQSSDAQSLLYEAQMKIEKGEALLEEETKQVLNTVSNQIRLSFILMKNQERSIKIIDFLK